MNIISLLTKKKLENIIKYSFLNFKQYKSYIFLDLLKCYGFFYATDSGISISIKDLKVSLRTFSHLNNLKNEILNKTYNWKKGLLSEKDRFDFIINSWSEITEDIKNDIVHYFETFDPLNSLFIMANSGARGNMSQVRQLIGVRGLMSDQKGNVINVPVNACFRNGLGPVDYIISAYGARKGVVDTAVKTAAAGYLTRRLIFLARNFLIKQIDCKTQNGILVDLSKTNDQILYGYTLLDIYKKNKKIEVNFNDLINFKDKIISYEFLNLIKYKKNYQNLFLKIRSVLTCNISDSLCQKCYGFDCSTDQLVMLGELIGIIAAQSIGEPGTQLTMRTFHTGGVFSVQKIIEVKSSFAGKIFLKNLVLRKELFIFFFKEELKKNRNFQSIISNSKAILYNCKEGYFKKLNINGFLSAFKFKFPSYIYNLEIFGQKFNADLSIKKKKLQPLIARKDYKILIKALNLEKSKSGYNIIKSGYKNNIVHYFEEAGFENIEIYKIYKRLKKLRAQFFYNLTEGLIMLTSGELFDFKKNYKVFFYKNICPIKKLAFSTLSSTNNCICQLKNQTIVLVNSKVKKLFNMKKFNHTFTLDKKSEIILILHCEEYKFFDDTSNILSFIVLPNCFKEVTYFQTMRDKNGIFILNIYTSLIKNFQDYVENDFEYTKKILSQNGLKYKYFQRSFMLFPKSILVTNNFLMKFILKNSLIAYFITQTIQGNDIVQGIPKVHQIVEAIKPKYSAVLSYKPGIIDEKNIKSNYIKSNFKKISFYINNGNFFNNKTFNKFFKINDFKIKNDDYIFNEFAYVFSSINIKFPLIFVKKNVWICKKAKENIYKKFSTALNYKKFSTALNIKFKAFNFKILIFNSKYKSNLKYNKSFIPILKIFRNFYFFNNENFLEIKTPLDLYKFLNNNNSTQLEIFLKIALIYKKFLYKKIRLVFLKFLYYKFFIYNCENHFNYLIQGNFTNFFKKLIQANLIKKKLIFIKAFITKYFYYLVKYKNENTFILKKYPLYCLYGISTTLTSKIYKGGKFINVGEPISNGFINPHELLKALYLYNIQHYEQLNKSSTYSINKFQLILLNNILAVYQGQEVKIALKHMEIMCKQLTSYAIYHNKIDKLSCLFPGEVLNNQIANVEHIIYLCKNKSQNILKIPKIRYSPKFISVRKTIIDNGFLSSASFQNARLVLTRGALTGSRDFCSNLKERVICGKAINAGTSFEYKKENILNSKHFYKLK